MVFQMPRDISSFDNYFNTGTSISCCWLELLTANSWKVDPAEYAYTTSFRPAQYVAPNLAESWEFPDASTYVVHLRKGVRWQDIPPVSGREFTADDVVYTYGRLFGIGAGFTKGSPALSSLTVFQSLASVTATDKYTVVFKWKTPSIEVMMENLQSPTNTNNIIAHEAVEKWGDLNDWHRAIGTGPFILKDFVSGSSATLVKNTNYWAYDERYPQNKIPYIDTLKILIIPDPATALAAMRTGKIDALDSISIANANSMKKTNPEIIQITVPKTVGITVDVRNDKAPFSDMRVRQALQQSIDLPTIASTYYQGTADPYPVSLTSKYLTGYGFPYTDWPQDLKDQYAYNTTAAKKLLADAGFPTGFKANIVADATADLDLLQIVKAYFAAIGVDMTVQTMDHTTWLSFVQSGHKQDQMALSSTGKLGYGQEPSRQISYFHTGDSSNYEMVSDPVFDAFLVKMSNAANLDEVKQVLKDANEYEARHHFSIALVQPGLFALIQPWLKGYAGQLGSISGGSGGPTYQGFYSARFWIDQKLKTSMGH
jgi:ABC-type transport system substrate-binding protein